MFSECHNNMSFHVQKWPDISNGWSDIPSNKEKGKKERKKRWGKKDKKSEGRGRKKIARMKNRKEKERKKSWDQVFRQKELLCWEYIYRHSSKFNGHGGSVVSAPASQATGRGSFPSCDRSYFPTSFFGFCR